MFYKSSIRHHRSKKGDYLLKPIKCGAGLWSCGTFVDVRGISRPRIPRAYIEFIMSLNPSIRIRPSRTKFLIEPAVGSDNLEGAFSATPNTAKP